MERILNYRLASQKNRHFNKNKTQKHVFIYHESMLLKKKNHIVDITSAKIKICLLFKNGY